MTDRWTYKNYFKKYDMHEGRLIAIGTGYVQVHDIFNPLPDFMLKADVLFSDPPCSEGNLQAFYTKADLEKNKFFADFQKRFFECVDKINPKAVFIEVFASNKNAFEDELKKRFEYVCILDSHYYHKLDARCWIVCASHTAIDSAFLQKLNGQDEQKIIEVICKEYPYQCIGDLCMGRGLVGYFANKYGRPFVGTELNKKRLAVLLERINRGRLSV